MSNNIEELKPCPFCGGKELYFFGTTRHAGPLTCYWRQVRCYICMTSSGAASGLSEDEAEHKAGELWNRRAKNAL